MYRYRYLVPLSVLLTTACVSDLREDEIVVENETRGPIGKADQAGSCEGTERGDNYCGEQSIDRCWCDDECEGYGDCCSDHQAVCSSCQALTCVEIRGACGELDDGCGGEIDCGPCSEVTDAFDPASCEGSPLTDAELVELFDPGETSIGLGDYEISLRKRSCNSVTGCGVWAPHEQLGLYQGTPLTGIAHLEVRFGWIGLRLEGHSVALGSAGSDKYWLNVSCPRVDPADFECSMLVPRYRRANGSLYPTTLTVAGTEAPRLHFQGEFRDSCLRLTATHRYRGTNNWEELDAALLLRR